MSSQKPPTQTQTAISLDSARNLMSALLRGLAGWEDLGEIHVDQIVQAIERDGNLRVEFCTCGPWHPDMDGPDEDCPVHGRSNADLWALSSRHQEEANLARQEARVARQETQQAEGQARDAIDALRNLVDLKDGPRDAHYEVAKPMAWDVARMMVASEREPSGDTVSTDFHKTVQRLIDESKRNPFMLDLPPIEPAQPKPHEITFIVGPQGKISQVILHEVGDGEISLDEWEELSYRIREEPTVCSIGSRFTVREVVVTRLPEDAETLVIEGADEQVPG